MNKSYCLLLIAAVSVATAFSQTNRSGKEDTLKTRIVTVFDYKPTVSDAKKLSVAPATIDTVLQKPKPQFLYNSRQYNATYTPDTIQAAKMKSEPLDPLYRSYVRGGLGNGVNYSLDGYINSVRSREGSLGLELHGRGTQGVLSDVPPAPYNRWSTAVTGKKFLKKHELTGQIGFDRERSQYYGYSYSDTLSAPYYLEYQGQEDVFKQVYTEVFANMGARSFYTDSSKVNHSAQLHYDHFFDRNAANNEHNIVLNGSLSKFIGEHLASTDVLVDFNQVNYVQAFLVPGRDSVAEKNGNVILGLTPKVTSQAKKWRLELGVNVQMDLSNDASELRLYPDVYAKYNLVKEVIIPYAGVKGGLMRNNLNNLTEQNPFLWSALTQLQNTDRVYHAFGGFRGSVSQKFTYNLSMGQYRDNNAPLFVSYNASGYNPGTTAFGSNYFLVTYDDITTFELGGEVTYRLAERLQVVGSGVYRRFITTEEVEAWQRPGFEFSAIGVYQIQNKILLRAGAIVLGPQKAKGFKDYAANDPDAVGVELIDGVQVSVTSANIKPIFDLNIGVEYRYTDRLSAFLNINNMLVQRYQRWNNYPTQSFNVLAGVTYSFWKE